MKAMARQDRIGSFAFGLITTMLLFSSVALGPTPPDLSVSLSAQSTATVNVNFPYTVTVTNIGGSSATGVTVTEVLAPGVSFISTGSSSGCTSNGGTVTCPAGTLSSGGSTQITIVANSSVGGTIKGVVGAIGNEADPNMANNSAIASTTVNGPAPTVTSVTPNSGTTAGGTSVTISGTNFQTGATATFGGAAATGVTFVNSTTLQATTPAHAAGAVNVVVTNPDLQSGTLTNGYTYFVPVSLSSLTLNPTNPVGGNTSVGTVTLTGAAPPGGATVTLSSSNTALATVPGSVIVPAGSTTATFTIATAIVNASASSTITGVLGVTKQATLTVNPIATSYSILVGSPNAPLDAVGWEIGTEFHSDQNGWITAIRFYKASGESSGHTGHLWDSATGTSLSTAVFQSETSSGWQEAALVPPVYVVAGKTYVVSYGTNLKQTKTGGAWPVDVPPLHGPRGCYVQGQGNFPDCAAGCIPTDPSSCSNFWVDVRLRPATNRTIFNLEVPSLYDSNQGSAYEVGAIFSSSQSGTITALRYYKAPQETGSHTARLWNATTQAQIGPTLTFSGETGAGWQEKAFASAIAITAGTTYVVSATTNAYSSKTYGGLTNGFSSPPLTISSPHGGRYKLGGGSFPNITSDSNFFVDIRFSQ
jgi:hypothetical protein